MPEWLAPPEWLAAFLAALFVGSLAEYWGHRMMHSFLLRKRHAEHHRKGLAQGWLLEFFDYMLGGILLLPLGFLYSFDAGVGFAAGGVFFACFAAYSHQLQHERPELCFWLKRPVHYIHHKERMWHYNFGISVDLWDRVFGTYKAVDWKPEPGKWSLKGYFTIKWI